MTRSHLLAAALAAVATALFAAPAHAHRVPADIKVPAGHKLYLKAHATGVQIYSCGTAGWTFVAPRADLYDRHWNAIGTHFGGPTWQANDGSTAVGKRVAGVNVDPSAIDWLLLSATSAPGPTGGDRFAKTTFIQRVNTTGGLTPPAADCTAATAGTTREVPYTADYWFWKARRA